VRSRSAEDPFSEGLRRNEPFKSLRIPTASSSCDRTAGISYFAVIRRRDGNLALCSSQGICRNPDSQQNDLVMRVGGATNPGICIVLRSVAKSMAVSEDRMRGQPLGESAAARLV